MPLLAFDSWLELCLTVAVTLSTISTIFLLTLPARYSNFDTETVTEQEYTAEDRKNLDRSSYPYFSSHKDSQSALRIDCTVQVVVLGDIGRSPRMQYHAISIANHGGRVSLVGYLESELHADVKENRMIDVVPIRPFPKALQTNNKALFLLTAPLKVLWQVWSLYYALSYSSKASKWMLVQNPPSIPTLIVAQFVCFFRNTRLIIDWHNFGYSILALRLGARHPLVRLSEWYEGYFSQGATAHFAVTDAMTKVLKAKWNVDAVALHDRPPHQFRPLTNDERLSFLRNSPETQPYADALEQGERKLAVSSTSWTADEDFSLLLEALVQYSSAATGNSQLPKLLVIITGKGPLKNHYLGRIQQLNKQKKLTKVLVKTAWLSMEDYASLLGSADIGISLHTSSSGVDLPMKVVDMLGAGLPVLGWSKFEAWPELIREGENGCGFESADQLAKLLEDLFGAGEQRLREVKKGAMKECNRRWNDEWMPVAGRILQLRP